MKLPWDIPNDTEVGWLLRQGLPERALLSPTLIRAANVTFLGRRTFDFDADGVRALLFTVEDDLVAWQPKRDALATWRGVAFALGQDSIFNPASFFGGSALRVHGTPLDWLRAERDGIVIVQPQLTYAYLRNAPRLSFADQDHARQVKRWRAPPRPFTEFLVEVAARVAA